VKPIDKQTSRSAPSRPDVIHLPRARLAGKMPRPVHPDVLAPVQTRREEFIAAILICCIIFPAASLSAAIGHHLIGAAVSAKSGRS